MRSSELVDWIHGARRFGEKKGLNNMEALLSALGNPEQTLKCVHVAGTNAKGSVCALIESALRAAGFVTGLYTSPYLVNYAERIRINGAPVDEELFERAGNLVREAAHAIPDLAPTAFELGTALAYLAFRERGVDVAVIETGIGGRLDPTNVIVPEVSVIANIGLDHMEQLGGTIREIANEKAGIIKSGRPVALYPQKESTATRVIEEVCQARGAKLLKAESLPLGVLDVNARGARFRCEAPCLGVVDAEIRLAGRHQIENAHLAVAALELLTQRGWALKPEDVARGFAAARWPGRLDWADDHLLLDGAHNPQAARALREYLKEFLPGRRLVLLTAMMRDKQPEACAQILAPCAKLVIATQVEDPRALPAGALADIYRIRGVRAEAWPEPGEALEKAREAAGLGGVVVACGSLYLVGEILKGGRNPQAAFAQVGTGPVS
jgi:dihydrofolate synthase/folylpolyglutamate synthase